MAFSVDRVNPLELAGELKALFAENDRPDFPGWFDRAYPAAVADGAASWVARAEDGRVIVHVGCFPVQLSVGGRDVRGGLLVNLMADRRHRTFFPVAAAIRAAVRDREAAGDEFLYTNPMNAGSVAAMAAAGLRQVGSMNRFVFPAGHPSRVFDLGVRARLLALRARHADIRAIDVDLDAAVRWTTETRCAVAAVTPRRAARVYPARLEGFGRRGDHGYQIVRRGAGVVGAAIVRTQHGAVEGRLVTLRCLHPADVAGAAAALAGTLRRRGIRRVSAELLMDTEFARRLVRGGFIQRDDPWVLVAVGFTPDGRDAVSGLGASDLESIDVD